MKDTNTTLEKLVAQSDLTTSPAEFDDATLVEEYRRTALMRGLVESSRLASESVPASTPSTASTSALSRIRGAWAVLRGKSTPIDSSPSALGELRKLAQESGDAVDERADALEAELSNRVGDGENTRGFY